MSTTSIAPLNSTSNAATPRRRSPVERFLVWGGILFLLVIVAYEYSIQRSFQKSLTAMTDALQKSETDVKAKAYLTNLDVPALIGSRAPDFAGDPGQTQLNSHYYEAYVWRSLLKRKYVAPPREPEIIDQYAITSGEVPPEKVKYRTPGLDKNRSEPASSFDAYTLYIYYGFQDPVTGAREVIHISAAREPYVDEVIKIPTAAELLVLHQNNLARQIASMEELAGRKLTAEEKDKLDHWKYPLPPSSGNRDRPSSGAAAARPAASPKSESATVAGSPAVVPAGESTLERIRRELEASASPKKAASGNSDEKKK